MTVFISPNQNYNSKGNEEEENWNNSFIVSFWFTHPLHVNPLHFISPYEPTIPSLCSILHPILLIIVSHASPVQSRPVHCSNVFADCFSASLGRCRWLREDLSWVEVRREFIQMVKNDSSISGGNQSDDYALCSHLYRRRMRWEWTNSRTSIRKDGVKETQKTVSGFFSNEWIWFLSYFFSFCHIFNLRNNEIK